MKILVINIKYLGDLIVSTPGLRQIRKKFPDAEIVFLLRKNFVDVLKNNPNINRFLLFDPAIKGNSSIKNFLSGISFINKIRSEKFDVILALHPGDRIAVWSWFSGAKIRIAPRKQSLEKLFTNLIDVEEDSISYLDYYNKIFESYSGKIESNKTEFFVPEDEKKWAEEFLSDNKILRDDIIIGIHPGASEPTKIWPRENFVKLFEMLNGIPRVKLLMIEGPQDKYYCDRIKQSLSGIEFVEFISDNITKTAALIKNCDLFITHDTGTRHLSVAVETPVLAMLPEDNLKYWNFYDDQIPHYSIMGKRNIPNDNELPFLDCIEPEIVFKKIGEILKLW